MANIVKHYGTPRRSGRYPWGSGKDPFQSGPDFLGYVDKLRKQGVSDTDIAKGLGITTTQLRAKRSLALSEQRAADAAMALRLKEKGMSNVAIGERMGINESSVRSLLDPALREKANSTAATADVIRSAVDSKKYIDIGAGVEQHLGVSRTKLNTAIALLEEQGYEVQYISVKQVGTGKNTSIKVLVPPGTPYAETSANRDKISTVFAYSEDGGQTFRDIEPVVHLDSNRILVRYGDEGGSLKDGVIELRRGVDDISLGDSRYAQVRIGVDGTHYMKGMAMYADKMPPGVDIIYNTNKNAKPGDPYAAFKPLKDDPSDPFGSVIRQKYYIDADGVARLSPLNIVGSVPGAGEEGSWGKWSKTLSSQVLSKQSHQLAENQLKLALAIKQEEFDAIMSITNPAVKKRLLETFADDADAAAVHLKAAALPRQMNQVILPINSLKDNEVYAPNFRNGEQVVLIRHPHGGIFEIPELTVNNRNQEGKSLLGQALDAIGINSNVASRLSGADFDGDTVIVIPNKNKLIKTAPSIKALMDFDPKTAYPKYPGMSVMKERTKQLKMGDVSNLITDMTIKGADHDEIARAVRHSMVVIDAVKHELNYKQSYIDNGIAALKEKYQGSKSGGAATLISRVKSVIRVNERTEGQYVTDPKTGKTKKLYVDPKSGKKLYTETGETYINRNGRVVKVQTKTTKGAYYDDASKLSSGTKIETVYAKHANALKSLANLARKTILETDDIPYSPSARKTFAKEVASLSAKLADAFRNKPLERKAQLVANKAISMKKKANPDMTPDQIKKTRGLELERARARVGAKKQNIKITDKEWQAIQAGAISKTALKKILANTDVDALKQRAIPRTQRVMSPAKLVRARTMANAGYTQSEIADALGVSVSTVNNSLSDS